MKKDKKTTEVATTEDVVQAHVSKHESLHHQPHGCHGCHGCCHCHCWGYGHYYHYGPYWNGTVTHPLVTYTGTTYAVGGSGVSGIGGASGGGGGGSSSWTATNVSPTTGTQYL